jgi:hypothetical protein
MPFAVLMVWREPKGCLKDCYFAWPRSLVSSDFPCIK